MKISIKHKILFFALALFTFAGAYISEFKVRSENDKVILEWTTGQEDNLRNFVIERRTPNSQFIEISTVNPKGNNSFYSYTDDSAYKVNDLFFSYRLKIVDNNNKVSYCEPVSVSHRISSVKRTWGSIKAMFR